MYISDTYAYGSWLQQNLIEMPNVAAQYGIPPELKSYIDEGFLEVVFEEPQEKTVHLVVPSLDQRDENGDDIIFTLIWIHPNFNAQYCHLYHETPGDLPNFYLKKQKVGAADEQIDIESLDDLTVWLEERCHR